MCTEEELEKLEKLIPHSIYGIKLRVKAMPDKQAKERCVELGKKIDTPQDPKHSRDSAPAEFPGEHYEYALLKERLGEDCSKRAD